eukprot:CCRYP_000834-RA/>CCRYP_000834-RA protein AED:0.09 eAED:0.09 QI:82/1/1/1/1/1/4/82/339
MKRRFPLCSSALLLAVTLNPNAALLPHNQQFQWPRPLTKNVILFTKFRQKVEVTQDEKPTRSTSNPDYEGGSNGNELAKGREHRRARLHSELIKLGINPDEIESNPEQFGTSALRTYNSFILPKSAGALAVAESPTRAKVVANNMSFLIREYKADRERWIRNVDKHRTDRAAGNNVKHSMTIILDNVRSAPNVGNILRLGEAAQVESVRLCGMTPRPPHPKVLKTAMGSAELVSLGADEEQPSTLQTVLDLKSRGVTVFGVETTENSTTLWDATIPEVNVAYVFGNELIGVDVEVLRACDGIISLPTYGIKNSLNVANCVSVVVWETLRRWHGKKEQAP